MRFARGIAGNMRVIIGMEQVQGHIVRSAREQDDPEAIHGPWKILGACDGLITSESGVLLTALVADCVPVFLIDQVVGVIGLLHAGWRGTAGEILRIAIRRLVDEHGTDIRDLWIYLGPSIEGSCYPVGKEVLERFTPWISPGTQADSERRLDLRQVLGRQAEEAGIPADQIVSSGYCTRCSIDLFYSVRRSKGNNPIGEEHGRMAAFIGHRNSRFP